MDDPVAPGMNIRKAVRLALKHGATYSAKRRTGEGRLTHPVHGSVIFNVRRRDCPRALLGFVRKCVQGGA